MAYSFVNGILNNVLNAVPQIAQTMQPAPNSPTLTSALQNAGKFDISRYSPEELRNYWSTTLNQYGGNEQQAAQAVYQNAQRMGAGYNDLAQFANTISPGSTDWLNRSILNYANQDPTGFGTHLAAGGNLVGIFNQQQTLNPALQPTNPYPQVTNTQGLSSLYNQQPTGGTTPQTPKIARNPNTTGASGNGVNYTSGSTVNTNATIYPQTMPNLNNYRGATYFNPQQNQYVTGGGTSTGF